MSTMKLSLIKIVNNEYSPSKGERCVIQTLGPKAKRTHEFKYACDCTTVEGAEQWVLFAGATYKTRAHYNAKPPEKAPTPDEVLTLAVKIGMAERKAKKLTPEEKAAKKAKRAANDEKNAMERSIALMLPIVGDEVKVRMAFPMLSDEEWLELLPEGFDSVYEEDEEGEEGAEEA